MKPMTSTSVSSAAADLTLDISTRLHRSSPTTVRCAVLHYVRLQSIYGAGMPYAASVAARRSIAVRRVGSDFTLLRFNLEVNIDGFIEAAARRAVPLVVVDVDFSEAADLYSCNLLSRVQINTWRGAATSHQRIRRH